MNTWNNRISLSSDCNFMIKANLLKRNRAPRIRLGFGIYFMVAHEVSQGIIFYYVRV